jgi:hypothetical protein
MRDYIMGQKIWHVVVFLWALLLAYIILVGSLWHRSKTKYRLRHCPKGKVTLLSDKQKIAYNEDIILKSCARSSFGRLDPADACRLIPHPYLLCRASKTEEELAKGSYGAAWYFHGVRSAVWRADMNYPECADCLVEDPYE